MFKKFTNGCVRVVNRWLPDAFLFAVILTIVVFIGALAATGLPVFSAAKDAEGKPVLGNYFTSGVGITYYKDISVIANCLSRAKCLV